MQFNEFEYHFACMSTDIYHFSLQTCFCCWLRMTITSNKNEYDDDAAVRTFTFDMIICSFRVMTDATTVSFKLTSF